MTLDLVLRNSSGNGNTSTSIPLIASPAQAVLDSASPLLELPKEVCFDIAKQLDLEYDNQTGRFDMSEPILTRLEDLRPSLRFGLGFEPKTDISFEGPVETELPFEALSHMHIPQIIDPNGRRKRYFPMRIANKDRGIVLGRAFFQEMYVTSSFTSSKPG